MERGILMWILVGLVAGAIAKLIMPGKDPGGIVVTILVGVGGSIVGGWLVSLLLGGVQGPAGIVGSVVGALILLGTYRMLRGRRVA